MWGEILIHFLEEVHFKFRPAHTARIKKKQILAEMMNIEQLSELMDLQYNQISDIKNQRGSSVSFLLLILLLCVNT